MKRLRNATVIVVVLMIGGLVMVGFSYLYLAAHVGPWADDHKAAISASSQPYLKEDVLIAGMIMAVVTGLFALAGTILLRLYLQGEPSGFNGLRITVSLCLAAQLTCGWWASALASFDAVDSSGVPVVLIDDAPGWLLVLVHGGPIAVAVCAVVAMALLLQPKARHGVYDTLTLRLIPVSRSRMPRR
ncbi:hypothetical protein ACPPVO_54395 [Dactylosporangium sp. McL0621]|uniref:hypothetical protein n=1 Tax=Dactylosporangium sp. McL0621 TaxID=3415678 RepID=UPI003CF4D33B